MICRPMIICRECNYYECDDSGECAVCAAHRERKVAFIAKIERMVGLGLRSAIVKRIKPNRLFSIREGYKAPTVDEIHDINILSAMYGVE